MKAHYDKNPEHQQKIELAEAAGSLGIRCIDYFDTQPGTLPYVAFGNQNIAGPTRKVEQFDIRPEDN
jgi:hypothetical protein